MTSWLIGLRLSDSPSDQVRAKVECCKTLTTVARSRIAQPPGSHPSALRATTHGQQVAFTVRGGLTSLQGAVGIFYSPSQLRKRCYWALKSCIHFNIFIIRKKEQCDLNTHLGAGLCTIHDGMASVDGEFIFHHAESFYCKIITRVDHPSNKGKKIFSWKK